MENVFKHFATLDGYGISVLSFDFGTTDSYGFESIEFDMHDPWDKYGWKAVFTTDKGPIAVVPTPSGVINIPPEASASSCGLITFVLVKPDGRLISVSAKYRTRRHGPITGDESAQPTQSLLDQLLEKDRIRDIQENARVENETARISAEEFREQREIIRQANEESRKSEELRRQSNEAERILSEQYRKLNEDVRQVNESVRIASEKERKEYYEAFKKAVLDGEFDGKDGISATHEWNGSVLTITSASGTSSANLQGPPGPSWQPTQQDIDNWIQRIESELHIPTMVSELLNDSGFITRAVNDLLNYYTKSDVDSRISSIPKFKIEVVSVLPVTGISDSTIYLLKTDTQSGNLYTEYIHVNGQWEVLGSQKIDLSNYATKDDLNAETNRAQTVEDDLLQNIHALQALQPIQVINLDGLMTPAQLAALDDGLYYAVKLIQHVTPQNSIGGLLSIHGDYVNSVDYGLYFGDFNGSTFTDVGSIDGFGSKEAEGVIGEIEEHLTRLDDKIEDISLAKFPNATIIGSPTINQGQISGFSQNDYLQFPFLVNFGDRPFEIRMAFTTGSDVVNQQNIFDSPFGLAFAVSGRRFILAISSNGTSWNVGAHTGSHDILPNTSYYVKVSWNRLVYKVEYSLNKVDYITDISVTAAQSPYPEQIVIGIGDLKTTHPRPFGGIINMNYCSVYILNELIWDGMDDVGLATRANVSLSNLDEVGEERFASKLTEPENLAVGKYFRIAAIDSNGHSVLEAVDVPSAGHWETVYDGVWSGNIELHPVLYDGTTGIFTFSQDELDVANIEIGETVQCLINFKSDYNLRTSETFINYDIIGNGNCFKLKRVSPTECQYIDYYGAINATTFTCALDAFWFEIKPNVMFNDINSNKVKIRKRGKGLTLGPALSYYNTKFPIGVNGITPRVMDFSYGATNIATTHQPVMFFDTKITVEVLSNSLVAEIHNRNILKTNNIQRFEISEGVSNISSTSYAEKINRILMSVPEVTSTSSIFNGEYLRIERWVE